MHTSVIVDSIAKVRIGGEGAAWSAEGRRAGLRSQLSHHARVASRISRVASSAAQETSPGRGEVYRSSRQEPSCAPSRGRHRDVQHTVRPGFVSPIRRLIPVRVSGCLLWAEALVVQPTASSHRNRISDCGARLRCTSNELCRRIFKSFFESALKGVFSAVPMKNIRAFFNRSEPDEICLFVRSQL